MAEEKFKDDIRLQPYDPDWPLNAVGEIARLKGVMPAGSFVDVQHVGSTAIPGAIAKPIIDIAILVAEIGPASAFIEPFAGLDYEFWAGNPNKTRMFFVKGRPPVGRGRTHHIHVFEDGVEFRRRVLFRDYLCAHPGELKRYETLKFELAAKFPLDREAYTEGKTAFVDEIVRKASLP